MDGTRNGFREIRNPTFRLITGLGVLAAFALAAVLTLLPGNLERANADTINWTGNGTNNGVCSDFEDDEKLDPGPGEQGWLFILTSPDPGPWVLTANFNPGGQVMANGVQQGMGAVQFVIYSPAGATLQSASATNGSTNSVLTVSHCEVNEEEPDNPTLIIYKVCDGDGEFTFSTSPSETIPFPTIECGENTGLINLDAGQQYDVTEQLPDGWVFGGATCTVVNESSIENGVRFTPGESDDIECTFTNRLEEPPENPTLVIFKVCVGDADADFSFDITPDEDMPFSTFGCGENSGTINIDPGTPYVVTELLPLDDGWTLTGIECTGVDETTDEDSASFTSPQTGLVECTFTNTFEEEPPENPTLVIFKACIGDEDADFSFDISPDEDMPFSTFGCGENSGTINIDPGTPYVVTELTPLDDGWTLTGIECTGVDETTDEDSASFTSPQTGLVECTFTNRLEEPPENPTLVIFKVCVGDADADFSFDITPDEDMPFSTFGCGENSGTINLDPGTPYVVTELLPLDDGWTLTGIECTGVDETTDEDSASFTSPETGLVECTFTNTFEEEPPDNPTLVIFKACIGDEDADFSFDISPDEDMPFSTFGCGENSGTISLDPGTEYEVTEDLPLDDGWTFVGATCSGINEATIDGGVSFTTVAGQTIVCTFTNVFETPLNPILIVFKDCIGGNGASFDFTLDGDGIVATPTLGCGDDTGIIDLEADTAYALTEDTPLGEGWTLTAISCTGIDEASIANGVSFTPDEDGFILCTFTNTFEEEVVIAEVVPPTEPSTPPQPPAAEVVTPPLPPASVVEPTPTLVAEVEGVQVISPPSTGTGGLAGEDGRVPWPFLVLALGIGTLGLVSILWARTQR